MVIAAAIYCRISKDDAGTGLGVGRQRDDCLALAESLGWPVAGIYTDNDVSAYSGTWASSYQSVGQSLADEPRDRAAAFAACPVSATAC